MATVLARLSEKAECLLLPERSLEVADVLLCLLEERAQRLGYVG